MVIGLEAIGVASGSSLVLHRWARILALGFVADGWTFKNDVRMRKNLRPAREVLYGTAVLKQKSAQGRFIRTHALPAERGMPSTANCAILAYHAGYCKYRNVPG